MFVKYVFNTEINFYRLILYLNEESPYKKLWKLHNLSTIELIIKIASFIVKQYYR